MKKHTTTKKSKTTMLVVRIDEDLKTKFLTKARNKGKTMTQVVIEMIGKYAA